VSVLGRHAAALADALEGLGTLEGPLAAAADALAAALGQGGKVLVAGNGGSAAEAQHLSGELVGRLHPARERPALGAIALHADTSSLTAVANDYGYERVFARQVEALGRPGDALVVLSTSGASPNLLAAVQAGGRLGLATVGLLGPDHRALHECCTHVVAVPARSLAAVQECHLVLVHVLVEMVEDRLGLLLPHSDPAPDG